MNNKIEFYMSSPNGTKELFNAFNNKNNTNKTNIKTAIYVNNTNFNSLKESIEKNYALNIELPDYVIAVKTQNNITNQVWLINYEFNGEKCKFLQGADVIFSDKCLNELNSKKEDISLEKII